ncbi:hypothetical protein COPRO5265_0081 [Coprothermobacter proteolyticus DSM 5265]|uniref:Protease n=1 Tax=Coprothermobacter proteolyticus (strain ATCC 35245 / DSM 5265 / OCM 4 / BT) TaxID=309798 RepID=B5Y6Q5_COPPD|nr:hypothetical protein COPRO5265_0081 [Coprothermobacter proteolyticus DSM 5265]
MVSNVKKTISLILALVLIVTVLPLNVFAETPSASNAVNFGDLDQVKDQVIETIKNNAEKANVPVDTVDIGGGFVISKDVYEGIKALGGKAKVIVEVNQASFFDSWDTNLNAFKNEADKVHAEALNQVKSAVPNFVKQYDLYATLNGFTGVVTLDQLKDILSLAGKGRIAQVYISKPYHVDTVGEPISYESMQEIGVTPDMVNSAPLIGAPEAWNLGYTGAGTYVAVIDTGIDYTHENFGGYSSFPNAKIPYGYDFADGDNDPMDHNGHGTHVSGTIGGIGKAKFKDKDGNLVPLKGVAPDAKIIICKVFSDYGPYAYSADIVAAIEYLIQLKQNGVNVVAANMSLGSDKGFDDPTDPEQKAIKNGYLAGITFAISAGNEAYFEYALGPNYIGANAEGKYTSYIKDPARVGAPGASRYAITVAAVNNQGTVLQGQKLSFNNDYVMYLTSSESPDPVAVFKKQPITIVDTNSLLCEVPQGDFKGKVLLGDRGTCTFEVKVNNARAAGASGVIIGNNDADASLVSMALGSAAGTIPAVFIGGPDKLKLRSAISAAGGSLQGVFSDEIATGYAATNPNGMASFTSWGPAPNMAFKPTVAAPGVAIFSSTPGNQYATMQGTSMAAPHVAGAIAVIKQAHPDWTPEQIKQALVNTAEPISKYSPRVQGEGRINVAKAVKNNVFITYNNQPYGELGALTGNKTITLTITNKGSTTYTANITGYVTTSLEQIVYGNQGATYTVGSISTPASVTVNPGATKTIHVTIQPSTSWSNVFIEGRLLFTSSDGTRVFPFLGYFGNWSLYSDKDTINGDSKWPDNNNIIDLPWWNADTWEGLTGVYYPYGGRLYYIGRKGGQFEPKALAISAGSDYSTWNDSLVVGLGMLRNARALTIYVLDSAGKVVKTIVSENFVRAAVNSSDSTTAGLRTGWSKLWEWDGTDRNGNFVPEGQYTIRIVAMPDPLISDEANLLPTQVMDIPVKVDKTPPTIEVSRLENAVTSSQDRDGSVIVPTASVFSLVVTGTDESSILTYYFGEEWIPAGSDPLNTAIIELPVLETVRQISGTTDVDDGTILAFEIDADDGAGNITYPDNTITVNFAYDNPHTALELENFEAIADGKYLKVGFDVLNAPGATYQMTIKDGNGSVVHTATGVVTGLDTVSHQEVKYEITKGGQYTVELTVTDIYGNSASEDGTVSFLSPIISILPDVTFMVVKQGTSTGIAVSVEGTASTGTVSLNRITVEDGEVKTTVVKAVAFDGRTFNDTEFIDSTLDAGRYQVNVEVESMFGQVFANSRRVVIDGHAPALDDVKVVSDVGSITYKSEFSDNTVDVSVRTDEDTTGQLILKISDDYTYFDVYLDDDHIGGWGDTGVGGEGTFFVPVNLDIGLEDTYELRLLDEAGNESTYTINLRVMSKMITDVKLEVEGQEIYPEHGGTYTVISAPPVSGTLTFGLSEDYEIESVSVMVNETEVATESPATLTFTQAGEYTIQIRAEDNLGEKETFEFTLEVIEDRPPEIQNVTLESAGRVLELADGGEYEITLPLPVEGVLTFEASDDDEVASISVKLNGEEVATESPATLTFEEAGEYAIEITAVDSAGQITTFTSTLRVIEDVPAIIENVMLVIDDETIEPVNGGEYEITLPLPAEGLLTFDVSDDVDVASTSVKLNGTEVGNSSPVTLNFTAAGTYVVQIVAVDSAGQTSTFEFTLNVVEEIISTSFELKLEAGLNYFGLPIYVDKTLGEILPGAKVYRRSGTSWVLATSEKPMAYAVYRVSLTEAKTVELVGEPFEPSSFTLKRNTSNYISIPQMSPVNANDLFGGALTSISVITTGGTMVKVTDGVMLPGKAYVVVVSKDVTINLPSLMPR